jgi:hypothetical protein
MADKKISALTAASTPLAGSEVLPIVQGGSTVKVSVDNLTVGKFVRAGSFQADGPIKATSAAFGASDITAETTAASGTGFSRVILKTADREWRIVNDASTVGSPFLLFDVQSAAIALTVDNSGNFTANRGNVVLGTAGRGIDFSANTHAAGMTSELLNDYEEGTWTPTGNNVTFASASGKYTKIGRQVTVTFDVTMPSTANTDQCQLQGLPFTVGSGGGASIGYSTNANVVTFLAGDTGTSINGYLYGGSALSNATYTGARVVGSCTYFV